MCAEVFLHKENDLLVWRNKAGKRHREDVPAIVDHRGYKEWYVNGIQHRADGPAVENPDGENEWWVNGEELTEEQFTDWQQQRQQEERDRLIETVQELCEKGLTKQIPILPKMILRKPTKATV